MAPLNEISAKIMTGRVSNNTTLKLTVLFSGNARQNSTKKYGIKLEKNIEIFNKIALVSGEDANATYPIS